jgi:hypothetical protein
MNINGGGDMATRAAEREDLVAHIARCQKLLSFMRGTMNRETLSEVVIHLETKLATMDASPDSMMLLE